MQAALIVMTILGCDDSVSQCHYVSTVQGAWQTVALCDRQSEQQLAKFSNSNYPVIVAVCETAQGEVAATDAPDIKSPIEPGGDVVAAPAPQTTGSKPTLPRRALAFLTGVLPDRAKMREIVGAPVRVIGDGYSWVAQKFR